MEGIKRRDLLRNLLPVAADAAREASSVPRAPQRRPPGALSEEAFLDKCTTCGQCSDACPQGAIFTFAESTGDLACTPVLLPERRPCTMCEGFPCVAACDDGALLPFEGVVWPLGKVRIDERRCLAYLGPECGACVGVCPHGIRAIEQVAWKPRVDQALCVGCGLCIRACPTTPSAIVLAALPEE